MGNKKLFNTGDCFVAVVTNIFYVADVDDVVVDRTGQHRTGKSDLSNIEKAKQTELNKT